MKRKQIVERIYALDATELYEKLKLKVMFFNDDHYKLTHINYFGMSCDDPTTPQAILILEPMERDE